MNAKQKLHQANLDMWNNRFQEQAQSGLSVKNWCTLNDISIHAYNYWKHVAKEDYLDSILPDIVPLANPGTPVPDYQEESKPISTISSNQPSQLDTISQQLALMNQRSFGRKTEKMDQIENQLSLFDVFNEPEVLSDNSREPEITEIIVSTHTRKKKTKREDKLEGLPARVFDHRIEEEELHRLFPSGYKELLPEVYKRLYVIPQTFMVDEHHIHVYAARNNDGTIVRASRPKDVFRNSVVTPALLSTIVVGKYANHIPLERQSQCYKDYGVELETNTMASLWLTTSLRGQKKQSTNFPLTVLLTKDFNTVLTRKNTFAYSCRMVMSLWTITVRNRQFALSRLAVRTG